MYDDINLMVNLTNKKKDVERIKRIKRVQKIKETGIAGALLFGFAFWGVAAFFTLWVYC